MWTANSFSAFVQHKFQRLIPSFQKCQQFGNLFVSTSPDVSKCKHVLIRWEKNADLFWFVLQSAICRTQSMLTRHTVAWMEPVPVRKMPRCLSWRVDTSVRSSELVSASDFRITRRNYRRPTSNWRPFASCWRHRVIRFTTPVFQAVSRTSSRNTLRKMSVINFFKEQPTSKQTLTWPVIHRRTYDQFCAYNEWFIYRFLALMTLAVEAP